MRVYRIELQRNPLKKYPKKFKIKYKTYRPRASSGTASRRLASTTRDNVIAAQMQHGRFSTTQRDGKKNGFTRGIIYVHVRHAGRT